jgi:hypothetical protein
MLVRFSNSSVSRKGFPLRTRGLLNQQSSGLQSSLLNLKQLLDTLFGQSQHAVQL